MTRAICFLGTDWTATENFSVYHPSAGRLQQPPWGQEICLDCTALPLYLGSHGSSHVRDPQTSRRNHIQRSSTELAPYNLHLPASTLGLTNSPKDKGRDVFPQGLQGARGFCERTALAGKGAGPGESSQASGITGVSQPALTRGCWLKVLLAGGVGRLFLQRARL